MRSGDWLKTIIVYAGRRKSYIYITFMTSDAFIILRFHRSTKNTRRNKIATKQSRKVYRNVKQFRHNRLLLFEIVREALIENKINPYYSWKFITLLLFLSVYHREILLCLGMLKCFDRKEFIRREAERESSFRKVPPICETAACRLRRSRWRLFTAIPPRIILSQFNQPVIKETWLDLTTLFLHLHCFSVFPPRAL